MSHGPCKGGGGGGQGTPPPWRGGGSQGWQRQDWSYYDYGGAQWSGGKGYGTAGRSDCWKCVACGCGKTTVWATHCKHCGDQATAAKYQGQLDPMAAAAKPPPKALQDQVSDLHHRIKLLDGRLEAELAKLARWQDGIRAQEILIHDLSKQSEAMVTEHRQLVAQLHNAVVPPSADTEPTPGPTLSLRDLVDGRVSNIVIDDGGLFSVDADGIEDSDLQEVERRRADFKERIGKAAKALFAEAMERAAVAKAEHDGHLKRMATKRRKGCDGAASAGGGAREGGAEAAESHAGGACGSGDATTSDVSQPAAQVSRVREQAARVAERAQQQQAATDSIGTGERHSEQHNQSPPDGQQQA
ncbi:unnamed protein product [Prorocentrum cordatum]|uniref:RanBP2-type domain-containing protein n=1 Tax=Prorocentrum cordatum TaxID=2364126 RepID=A0ABN9PCR3_9DINO|nr:unnamed protein product [Polarella glacialis]